MRTAFFVLALMLPWPAIASADAMPSCPSGTHLETNPVPAGSMHHGGGRCVDNPGGCSIAHATSGAAWLALVGVVGLVSLRRSRR